MDPELSRRLDRIERRIKIIGELAIAGFGLAGLLVFFRWGPDMLVRPLEWPWFVLGMLASTAISLYYRWQFNREPK